MAVKLPPKKAISASVSVPASERADSAQSLGGGRLLGALLAAAAPAADHVAVEVHLDHKGLVVVGTGLLDKHVGKPLLGVLLDDLLEHRLVVGEGKLVPVLERVHDEAEHESARRFDPPVEVDRREQRLKRVGQNRWAGAPPHHLLAASEFEVVPQRKLPRELAEGFFAHHRRAQLGEVPLREVEGVEEIVGNDDREHRVPQKLLPLVAREVLLHLVGVGGVGQRDVEVFAVLEGVSDPLLKRGRILYMCFHLSPPSGCPQRSPGAARARR